jgi:hypothetical protein
MRASTAAPPSWTPLPARAPAGSGPFGMRAHIAAAFPSVRGLSSASGAAAAPATAAAARRIKLDAIPMFKVGGSGSSSGGGCGGGAGQLKPSEAAESANRSKPAAAPVHSGDTMDWRWMLEQAKAAAEAEDVADKALMKQYAAAGNAGVHPMLVDRHERAHTYLRISITERCNLRCTYCMPAEGVELTPSSRILTTEEVLRLAALFVSAGVNKIRLTGGEPTLRKDLPAIVERMGQMPGLKTIGMTSNGIVLARTMKKLRASGLNALNLSLDTLKPERFAEMTRRAGLQRVLDSIDAAVDCGFDPVKLNVVSGRGDTLSVCL